MRPETRDEPRTARLIVVTGAVQGVGYRPFVRRLADRLGITGSVANGEGDVRILAEGDRAALARFERALLAEAPPLARPRIAAVGPVPPSGPARFEILPSRCGGPAEVHLVPDAAPCPACLAEMADPAARRHGYPFTNCTACGPRYTIVRDLPYDRRNTAMADFPLCADCRREYEAPDDRRFHAEPLACPACGPTLAFRAAGATAAGAEALAAAVAALRAGQVVAVRGVGGYRVMVDARDAAAVARLRARKRRPDKPFAVLFSEAGDDRLDAVRGAALVEPLAAAALVDQSRPIVLLPLRPGAPLAPAVAPGLATVGAMLPTSPLDHLLAAAVAGPLVATSGNVSGEPILTDAAEAAARLAGIADAVLDHDRAIERPADDPVVRVVAGAVRAVRLGRGTAPLELPLPHPLGAATLAVGGQQKVAVALGDGERAIVSPHLGDHGTPRGERVFREAVAALPALYRIGPQNVVCDAHPGYGSTRWAAGGPLPRRAVLHHHAHASAVAGEHPDVGRWLVFAWDAVGLGEDGTLWGGEALYGAPGAWRRVASLRPFRLPGGEAAARQPWRSAASLAWEAGLDWDAGPAASLARQAWERGLNTPMTTAVGRLFDAAAAFVLGLREATYEGHGPARLEAIAAPAAAPVPLPLAEVDGILRLDWAPLLPVLMDGRRPAGERAGILHASLAAGLTATAVAVRATCPFEAVGLAGGVFQNRLLAESAVDRLATAGVPARLPVRLPAGDGGLAFGQLVEAAARGHDG